MSLKSPANLLKVSEMFLALSVKDKSEEAVRTLLSSESLSASLKLTDPLKTAMALAS